METVGTSTKIKCLIEMALKGEIAWTNIDFLIDGLTPTLARSREIIRILLKELQTHQTGCLMKFSSDGISEVVIDDYEAQSKNDKFKEIQESNSKENVIDVFDKSIATEELMKLKSEEVKVSKENELLNLNEQEDFDDYLNEDNFEENLLEAIKYIKADYMPITEEAEIDQAETDKVADTVRNSNPLLEVSQIEANNKGNMIANENQTQNETQEKVNIVKRPYQCNYCEKSLEI